MAIGSISKVLLLDPAFAAMPIHDFLVSRGFDVWTMGNRAGDPLALGFPDRWIRGDYSDVGAVRSIISKFAIEAVVPGCTDVSMATFVASGFEGPYRYSGEADAILNVKDLFRKLCVELDLPSPRTVSLESLPPCGQFICKPVDSFSGRGVTIFDASDAFAAKEAFETASMNSPTSQAICEEFVEGQLYSYSSFLKEGQVDIAFVVREGSRYDPFAVDVSYVVDWSDNPRKQILKESVEKIASNLNLCDGLVHVQFIANDERIALLEITRRCPGDLYSQLIEYSTGFPYASKYASYFVGISISEWKRVDRHILRHTIKQPGGTQFDGFDFDLNLKIRRVIPVRSIGENIEGTGFQRTGLLLVEGNSSMDLQDQYERLTKRGDDRGCTA